MTTDMIAGSVIIAVFAIRILLWSKFRNHWRGSSLAIGTMQLAIVVIAAGMYNWFGERHAAAIVAVAVSAIAFLSSLRIKQDEKNVRST